MVRSLLTCSWMAFLAGCTLNIAPNAKEVTLFQAKAGDVGTVVGTPAGTNGVAAVQPNWTEPQSTSERVIYVLFAIATAAYPIWRQIRKWREKRRTNGTAATDG